MKLIGLRAILFSSVPALLFQPAFAQDATPPQDDQAAAAADAPSDIVVTGSRIVRDGFQQPTPVTVVGAQEIQQSLPNTIADYVNELPSFGVPSGPSNPANGVSGGGLSLLNLRNLGTSRTLVLLDSRRVVSSSVGGGVDINTLPSTLVERVEVVTGGASASWGADAVAGVVNFVLNHNYEGIGVSAQTGISEQGDDFNWKGDLTFGTSFAGGRGHIVAAGQYSTSPDIVHARSRDWSKDWAVVPDPDYVAGNGEPRQITVSGAGPFEQAPGGVIVSGPLRGTQFIGPNGTPAPFDFGNPAGVLQWDGDESTAISGNRNLTNALDYGSAFVHARYDLTDDVTIFAEGSYGNSVVRTSSLYYPRLGNLVIQVDNAFLDPGVRQDLIDRGETSFRMGVINATDGPPPGSRNERTVWRGVLGAEGKFGSDWTWNAYYQYGDAESLTNTYNNPLVPRYNQAVDAVLDPATNRIVCRSTLSNPANGCVPYNVFGVGGASDQSVEWIFGTVPFQLTKLKQEVWAADISGTVFSLPAGKVSIALGAEYSTESATATQDDQSLARNYFTGNFQPFTGKRNVKEAFAEIVVPVLHDTPFFKRLELNAAARLTDYSTSGSVVTWKLGVSNEITDDLRVRVTRSRDIRAPSLSDLFTAGRTGTQNVFDPVNNQTYAVLANTRGNPILAPEDADTWTAGVVYRPEWLPGLGMSVDYYNIKVKGAIDSITSQQTVLQCVAGNQDLCDLIIRAPTGEITQIDIVPTNINLLSTSGFDAELSYRGSLGGGTLTARALGSYLAKFDQTDANGDTRELAGAIGDFVGSQPKFKALLSATYEQGAASATARVRVIGAAKLDNDWVEGVDVDDNTVPAIAYLDLRASYSFELGGRELELTAAVDNVLDTDPRRVASVPNTTAYQVVAPSTRLDLYDAIGRSYRIGFRIKL